MMRLAPTLFRFSNALNAQFAANKNRNAVRFESQNLNWDFEVVQYHSKAFAKGLKSLNFGKGDNILLLTPSAQQAQAYVSKVGSSYIDANLLVSQARSVEDLDRELRQNNIKALIFEPTLALSDDIVIDGLYKLIPQIKHSVQGSQIQPKNYSNLKFLFQTNFYSYNGVFKYRSLFNYSKDSQTPFTGSSSHQPIALQDSTHPLIITQPANDLAFRAGILNSLINGRFVVVAEPQDVQKVSDLYDGKVDIIATEDVSVNNEGRVYVASGSSFAKSHSNRVEVQ